MAHSEEQNVEEHEFLDNAGIRVLEELSSSIMESLGGDMDSDNMSRSSDLSSDISVKESTLMVMRARMEKINPHDSLLLRRISIDSIDYQPSNWTSQRDSMSLGGNEAEQINEAAEYETWKEKSLKQDEYLVPIIPVKEEDEEDSDGGDGAAMFSQILSQSISTDSAAEGIFKEFLSSERRLQEGLNEFAMSEKEMTRHELEMENETDTTANDSISIDEASQASWNDDSSWRDVVDQDNTDKKMNIAEIEICLGGTSTVGELGEKGLQCEENLIRSIEKLDEHEIENGVSRNHNYSDSQHENGDPDNELDDLPDLEDNEKSSSKPSELLTITRPVQRNDSNLERMLEKAISKDDQLLQEINEYEQGTNTTSELKRRRANEEDNDGTNEELKDLPREKDELHDVLDHVDQEASRVVKVRRKGGGNGDGPEIKIKSRKPSEARNRTRLVRGDKSASPSTKKGKHKTDVASEIEELASDVTTVSKHHFDICKQFPLTFTESFAGHSSMLVLFTGLPIVSPPPILPFFIDG